MANSLIAPTVAIVACIAACGPGGIMKPPKPPTAEEILGQNDAPLIIDWAATARGDLEVAMTRGVAILSYKDGHMRLLADCKLDGMYGYAPFRIKEEIVSYQSSEDIRANLPLAGGGFVAKIGGELEKGASLDVALVMVGKRASTWTTAKVEDIKGAPGVCAEATHFVRGAYVGAFAMQLGSKASAHTVVQIFNGEAGWQAAASQSVRTVDGSLEECRKSNAGVEQTTANCGSLLHLELVRLGAAQVDNDVATVGGAGCPKGFVRTQGAACRRAGTAKNHECKAKDREECETQCAAGNAESCSTLGWTLRRDRKIKRDLARVFDLFRKSCDAGSANGCAGVGSFYFGSNVVVKRDYAKAVELYKRACEQGSMDACSDLGLAYGNGLGLARSTDEELKLYRRACNGGSATGCNNIGAMYDDGTAVARDLTQAATYYKRACDGDVHTGCRNLALLYFRDEYAAKSAAQGEALLAHACDDGSAEDCEGLAARYKWGDGLVKNPELAAKRYADAVRERTIDCVDENDGSACRELANLYGNGLGVAKDPKKAQDLTQKACDSGNYANGCAYVGMMYLGGWYGVTKDLARAKQSLAAACDSDSGLGCRWLADQLRREDEVANAKAALDLDEKACALRDGEACNDIAVEYARGNHVEADPKKAAAYYLRACDDLHYGISCGNVGLHYERGDWFPKDEQKGNAYYALGCKYGEGRSCRYLAISMRDGTGMDVDNAGAAKMFDKACDMGENEACDKLIEMYMSGKAGSAQAALDLERKQCDAGRADACNAAGMLLEQGAGAVARNELQAAVLFQKACEMKSATGCVNLGDMYSEGRGIGKDDDKAFSFYELACGIDGARGCGLAAKIVFGRRTPNADDVAHAVDLSRRGCQKKDGVSCAVLASAYETGKPPSLPRDFVRAFASYDDACDAGAADGCMKAAQMLERGLGTTRDLARARNRYTMACLRRDAKGCAATAGFYLRGEGGAHADPARAKILYGRACALGDKPSCARAEAIR